MSIHIIATGGTIDKVHNPITESLDFEDQTHIPDILRQCGVSDVKHDLLMLKDSLDMTDDDRAIIYDHILKQSSDKIVITHGTSTMPDTAQYLHAKGINDKVIVLTGSMRPFSLLKSDAEFNFGGAVIAAQSLPPGVYIVMNGTIFNAENVKKNVEKGRFESHEKT
ncbi:MAG: asparaginase [Alphaproteobacteria bacterium]|nr:MAG: asparaginase [Alphaproteobacteria bacterium]